ncbi:MAG: hypothetical protein EBZ48_05230, partial [Proteobacteria bacterium]|nr:hypothetical protein [Pseudomonadota bacterium]
MGYHYNTYTGQMDNYTSSGYSLTDGSFNASAVQNTSSENTSYGYAGSSGAAALVGLLALFMLVALFTGLSMVFYELAMIWAQYHWPKAVALTVLAIIATLCARGSQSSSRNDPDAPARQAYFKSAAWLLWVAAIILPAGLSVRTLFFAPPLEVAVHKMNIDIWHRTMALNLLHPFLTCRYAVP